MEFNAQSCLSWNIPNLVRSHSSGHYAEGENATSFWTVLCIYVGTELCMYFFEG